MKGADIHCGALKIGILLMIYCSACVVCDDSNENSDENSEESEASTEVQTENLNNIAQLLSIRFATPCITPNLEPTYCVNLSDCPLLQAVAPKKKYAPFVEASRCGPPNEHSKNYRVCCGRYNNFRNTSKAISVTTPKTDVNVLPKSCGVHKAPFKRGRILGGKIANLGEYPWLARIRHRKNGYEFDGCAGFLIHKKYVVTAGHCVADSELTRATGPPYSITLGEHDVNNETDCSPARTYCAEPVQTIRIKKVVIHPQYNHESKNHYDDIALIQLSKGAELTDFVQPICLLTDPTEVAKKFYISGWGKTETGVNSPVKRKLTISLFDKEKCIEKFNLINLQIMDKQICAGGESMKDSCSGDSGGPLMMSPDGSKFFAAGLVSYGIGCGLDGWPGVYTYMPPYVNWIQSEILKLNEKSTRRRRKSKKRIHKKVLKSNETLI